MKLAADMCRQGSLPKNWISTYDTDQNRRQYVNAVSGEKRFRHPLIDYYKGAIFMERGGYEELLEKDREQPPTMDDVCLFASLPSTKNSV